MSMKTTIDTIAAFVASAIWADGEYDDAEKITMSEIAEALELDEPSFSDAIDVAIAQVKNMDEEAITKFLKEAGEKVDDEEIGIIFEAAMQMVLADGVLAYTEVSDLLVMAEALGIEEEYAILLLADMVKTEPDLDVDLDGDDE